MKRIIGLILCVAMLLSMASVGISASYQEHIPVSGSSQTIDGVSYKIVKTASELTSALSAGNKIMLANDIALTSASQITIKAGALLDGNGYEITYSGTLTAPLFKLAGGGSQTIIRNTQFGSSTAMFKTSGNVGLFEETVVSGSGTQNNVVWQNNSFYISNSVPSDETDTEAFGGLFCMTSMMHRFSGCTVNILLEASGKTLVGGWIGSAKGELYFDDCVTTGSIKGSYGVGGFMGQCTSGRIYMKNCVNHATINAYGYCGGISGNAGSGMSQLYFENCTNYGSVTSTATGYDGIAGGIIGRLSNTITYDKGVNGFYGCANYGLIKSSSSAGGIMGRHHETDAHSTNTETGVTSEVYQYLRFRDCINVGEVNGRAYAGGMAGAISPIVKEVTMDNCANIGKIRTTTDSGFIGNFAGLSSGAKVTNGFAAGRLVRTLARSSQVISGRTGEYTFERGYLAGTTMAIAAPVVSNVRYLTNIDDSRAQGATKVTDSTLAAMLADMKAKYGMNFVSSDDPVTAGTYLVVADPQIRGVQRSVASASSDKADLRFAAIVNALVPYESVGFRATIRANGQSIKIDRTAGSVYSSLKATSVNGEITSVTAASLSGLYLSAVTFTNIPATGDVSIEIAPYAVGTNGEEYVGKSRVIVVSKGAPKTETMLLNGVSLEKYSIVYPNASPNNEKLLAERLAKKIGEMLGHTVSCYSDSTAKKANEILVGKTNRHTPTVSGRWIYRPNEADTTVVLYASGTTALSEVVEHFLETLVAKRAAGQGSWRISGSISVPIDQQVSIMSYNTGAKEDSTIMAAEWDLIADTLPDILTMQEPWASFLTTFFNNYAVKPSTNFVASSKNVMSTNVTNKTFTGSGYYGVYWGAPRWKSSDSNQTGAASYSPILYAKDRFTVNTSLSGTFWLSNTPGTSGSMLSGSDHVRCATYATLTDKNTNESFVVVNVHVDYTTAVQAQQVNILLTQLKSKVGSNVPIIITGDMNASRNSDAMNVYFNNGWTASENMADISYHNNTTIDWILVNNTSWIKAQRYEYQCAKTFYNSLWVSPVQWGKPSDHAAVYAELTVDTGKTRPGANTETPPAADHAFGKWTPDPSTTDSHYRECECGEIERGMCRWSLDSVLVQATHTSTGMERYVCLDCGRTEDRFVDKLPTHSFTAWAPLEDATDGHYRDCYCGTHVEEPCDWLFVGVIKSATMFETGLERYTCITCKRTEDRVIPKLPPIEVDGSENEGGSIEVGEDTSTNMGDIVLFG